LERRVEGDSGWTILCGRVDQVDDAHVSGVVFVHRRMNAIGIDAVGRKPQLFDRTRYERVDARWVGRSDDGQTAILASAQIQRIDEGAACASEVRSSRTEGDASSRIFRLAQ